MKTLFIFVLLPLIFSLSAKAQAGSTPRLPAGSLGLQGSVGAGFADFKVKAPEADFRLDRGVFATVSIERGFNVMNLYLTLGLSNMQADGVANYRYTNLSTSTAYSANDVKFKASLLDLGLGLKLKLIDRYWFRPYIEGGGLGGYHTVSYTSKLDTLAAQGSDYKNKDVVMGSGYYGEGGIEAMFSGKFGVRLAARQSNYVTKNLETLKDRELKLQVETYYFSILFGM